MKTKFCKILLAVSFLFLVSDLCMSQNLKGIWKLVQSDDTSQVVRYKVLDKDGNYFNVDAYVKNTVDIDGRNSDGVFCPYKITRSGEYSIIAKGLYCEKLRNEHGRSANAIVPISYRIDGKKMTLLGTGGAAASIITQAALDGVPKIDVIARKGNSWNAVEQVIHRVNSRTDCKVCMYELKDEVQMRKSIDESAILINASSVGMSPHEEGCLVPDVSYFHPELIVSDVIYQPRKTRLLQMAESAGCPTFNGMYMLLYQGAYAFELWTGKPMPVELVKNKYFK